MIPFCGDWCWWTRWYKAREVNVSIYRRCLVDNVIHAPQLCTRYSTLRGAAPPADRAVPIAKYDHKPVAKAVAYSSTV